MLETFSRLKGESALEETNSLGVPLYIPLVNAILGCSKLLSSLEEPSLTTKVAPDVSEGLLTRLDSGFVVDFQLILLGARGPEPFRLKPS